MWGHVHVHVWHAWRSEHNLHAGVGSFFPPLEIKLRLSLWAAKLGSLSDLCECSKFHELPEIYVYFLSLVSFIYFSDS